MVAPAYNLTVMRPQAQALISSGSLTNGANAFDPQPGVKAAFSGPGWVVIDLFGVSWQQVFVGYTSVSLGQVIRVRASDNVDGITATPIDVTIGNTAQPYFGNRPSGYRHFLLHLSAPLTKRYIRIDSGAAMEVGRIAAGPIIQPEFNSDYGDTSWGYEEPDDPVLLDSGVEVLVERTPAPYLEFKLSWVLESEMKTDWEPLSRLAIEGSPVIVCRDPVQMQAEGLGHNTIYYGRLRLTPIVAADFDMYEVQGKIRSMV